MYERLFFLYFVLFILNDRIFLIDKIDNFLLFDIILLFHEFYFLL